MNRFKWGIAIVAGLLVAATATAQSRRPGFRPRGYYGRPYFYPGYFYPRSGFGFGLGFGAPIQRTTPKYRNAFTGDVDYAERTVNDFRAAYERRKDDPLGIKSEVQRLDEELEKMKREAETFGGITIRGTDLYRSATSRAEVLNGRLQTADDDLQSRWRQVLSVLKSLAQTYRVS